MAKTEVMGSQFFREILINIYKCADCGGKFLSPIKDDESIYLRFTKPKFCPHCGAQFEQDEQETKPDGTAHPKIEPGPEPMKGGLLRPRKDLSRKIRRQ